jgi:hypothetical protein
MKNRKYRLLSMSGFEMLQSWLEYVDRDTPEEVVGLYNLFVQFVMHSCNLDIGLTKQRVYFYDKINGNQYYIKKKDVIELAKVEYVILRNPPSEHLLSSIYMDRENNRKWINAQNLIKRY